MNFATSLIIVTQSFFLLVISFWFYRRFSFYKKKISLIKSKNKELLKRINDIETKEVLTKDAKDLLADLCHGDAIVKVTPINPQHIFEYSPRS